MAVGMPPSEALRDLELGEADLQHDEREARDLVPAESSSDQTEDCDCGVRPCCRIRALIGARPPAVNNTIRNFLWADSGLGNIAALTAD
jgi:hypothetical protein